ncbi:MAG TPA: hypothetical protein VLB44_15235 [Kofleriaceae bacterium]|nr:hypothetical protein [Kofleriaceae bacterium]
MRSLLPMALLPSLLMAGCSAQTSEDPEPGAEDPGEEQPADDFIEAVPAPDDGYVPKAFTATRFGVFYQVSKDVLDIYQDADTGLPQVADHAWLITQSHATAFASRQLADSVHRRADFYYAPAFDIWDASHNGWQTASDAQLRTWAHAFRDAAISAHADLFTFNEAPSTTGESANVRIKIAKILRFIHEPDAQGRVLWGVVYLTERAATASVWTSAGSDFFQAIDETSIALVAEHYHSTGFVCSMSESALADHYFKFRTWLIASGEPAKLSIANRKYTVLHSARFNDGPSGWSGGDSTKTTLANYQRAMSRIARVTRMTDGGLNRLAFAPTTTQITKVGVQPRITALFRWHYRHTAAQSTELPCIDNFGGNCSCQ